MNSIPSEAAEKPPVFPDWSARLADDASLSPGAQASYRVTLTRFLAFCRQRRAVEADADGRSVVLAPGEKALIPLGFRARLPAGYEVQVAADGPSALEAVAYSAPELILLDVELPGANGYEICRQLKNQDATRKIPVIFLTAQTVDCRCTTRYVSSSKLDT